MDDEDHFPPPPEVPAAIFAAVPGLRDRLAKWSPLEALAMIAGLQLDPRFAANTIRLEVATRLVMSAANGKRLLRRADLDRLLNVDLPSAGIDQNEDPPENFFVSTVATRHGAYRVHLGVWEKAAYFTEDLIEAFQRLPEHPIQDRTLDEVHALLKLADCTAHWRSRDHAVLGGGHRAAKIELPPMSELKAGMANVVYPWKNIERLGIEPKLLLPFAKKVDDNLEDERVGESALEARPLVFDPNGLIVVAPHNLTTAIRLRLARRAAFGGLQRMLWMNLMAVQAERVRRSSFFLPELNMHIIGNQPIGHQLTEVSAGRFVLTIQISDGFEDPPAFSFAGVEPDLGATDGVRQVCRVVQGYAREKANFREGFTLLLAGGWGRGRSIKLTADMQAGDWPLVVIETGDASDLGGLEHTEIADIWRITKQVGLVAEQGFELFGANGWPNLFGWWRETGFNLVPEQQGIEPPMVINFPTDEILAIRRDAAHRLDRRPLPMPDGSMEMVMRLDRDDALYGFQHRYCSPAALDRGELLGVVLLGKPVWLRVTAEGAKASRDTAYETWQAALHWLTTGLQMMAERDVRLGLEPVLIDFEMEMPEDNWLVEVDDAAVDRSVSVLVNPKTRSGTVSLSPDWQHGLHRMTNYAELRLAAALLSVVLAAEGVVEPVEDLHAALFALVGSDDIRWRHSFVADRPALLLSTHGLIPSFKEAPVTASALVRCGSSFLTRPREAGLHISGAEECYAFLMQDHEVQLGRLLEAVAGYDRATLVAMALARLQSALAEEGKWQRTARALRALHGPDGDAARSFVSRNEINAVIRGCAIITELAASHASSHGGLAVGQMDLDELVALALLVFQNAELLPPIRGGFVEPELRISPVGGIMYDHSFGEKALVGAARGRHAEERRRADDDYRRHFENPVPHEPDQELFAAIADEYGAPWQTFRDVFSALSEIAVQMNAGVFGMERSALLEALRAMPYLADFDCGPLIDKLTLSSRNGWLDVPPGTKSSDFDFTRFDRRHSIIKRPLVAISASPDPRIIVAPAVIERAVTHNMSGALQGGLHGEFWDSDGMRGYVGKAAARVGLEFNENVADAVRNLGLTSLASVKVTDALHQKGTEELKRLGDVDVLAFDRDGRRAWVIEAKEIRFCRNIAETAARLSEYRGRIDARGRRDNLRKHLDRVEHIRAHAPDLARRYKLPQTPEVRGLLVVGSHQPMMFLPSHASSDARVVMLSDLAEVDWVGRHLS